MYCRVYISCIYRLKYNTIIVQNIKQKIRNNLMINSLQILTVGTQGLTVLIPKGNPGQTWKSIPGHIDRSVFCFQSLLKVHFQKRLKTKNPQLSLWVSFCRERGMIYTAPTPYTARDTGFLKILITH